MSRAFAQPSADEILALPSAQRAHAMWKEYVPAFLDDTTKALAWMDGLYRAFERRGALDEQQQIFLIRTEYLSKYRHGYSEKGMRILDDALRFAQANKWAVPEAELLMRKGLLFELQGRYGPAFEYMQRGYRRLTDLGLARSMSAIALSEAMALAYYKFGSNAEAIRLLRTAIDIRPAWLYPGNLRKAANTLGMCYIREEKYDSAALYFDLAAVDAMAIQDTFWAALARGNKGYALYQQQDYAGALPLMEEDFAVSSRHGDLGSAVNAAMQLAAIHVRNGEIARALPYLAYGEKYLDRGNAGALSSYYKNLAEVSRLQGRLEDGLRYIDSFVLYKDKHAREKDIQVIHQAKVKVEVEQYAHQLDLLEQQRSRQVLIRNGLIVILAMGTVIALLVLRQYKARRLRERQLAQVREQAAQDELNAARGQLRIFTQALREKSELVETFRTELESLHAEGRADDRHEHLHQLLSSTILTEEDWKDFRILFDKVYPGFFERLRHQFADLTPAETRLVALTKLQLTPKEMAGMLGISYDAIKKTRQRLRKKIDLPEEGGLDELVDMI